MINHKKQRHTDKTLTANLATLSGQKLSNTFPGTFGVEVEQLFYHGPHLAPTIAIMLSTHSDSKSQSPQYLTPDDYFAQKEQALDVTGTDDGAYDQLVVASDLLEIVLDGTTVLKNDQTIRYYVPEFITLPFKLSSDIELQLAFCEARIKDFYQHCKNNAKNRYMLINQWVTDFNQTDLGKKLRFRTHDKEGQFLSPDNKDEHAEYVMALDPAKEVNPIFAIHVNTSIFLEQMYTLDMRQSFPIFTHYPKVSDEGKELNLKDWPSCRPNQAFETWEFKFTSILNSNVQAFVERKFAGRHKPSDHSLSRFEGLFRTLIYTYCIKAYCYSELKEKHFNSDVYETSYEKDFFLHGMPKVNFDDIVINGLTSDEKRLLKGFIQNDHNKATLISLFKEIAQQSGLQSGMSASFGCGENCMQKVLNVSEFVTQALVIPLVDEVKTNIGIVPKVIIDGLPSIKIGNEVVKVPVLEFRAPLGNGCDLQNLGNLLQDQANRAREFAQAGVKQYLQPSVSQAAQHTDKKIKI